MEAAHGSKPPRRWLRLIFFGVLFEFVLLALAAVSSHFSVFTQFRNFVLLIHIPLLWVVIAMNSAWLPFLLIPVPILFWAIVFDGISRLWAQIKSRPIYLRRKRWWQGGLVCACLATFAFVAVSLRSETPTPFNASEATHAAVNGNTAFALDLYQELRKRPGNLFFSPYSVSSALAMTAAGARGQTKSEMTNALHFSLPSAKIHAAFGELGHRMNQIERWNRITLKTANGLWVQKNKPINAAFLDLARNDYFAEVRQADFRSSPSKIGEEINLWIEKRTGGKFKGAIAAGRILPDTKMVLCNAIYFKGTWKKQFKVSDTKPMPFHLSPRETITVPTMYQRAAFKMAYDDERIVDMLELPYSGGDLSMVILLPSEYAESSDGAEDELSAIEEKLTAARLQIWLAKLDRAQIEKIHVSLPMFTTTQHYELVNGLKKLGMSSAFGAEADFSGIEGTTNLFISDFVHQAFVEVNEAGTEAAAMTFEIAKTKGMDGRFIADRPFIFLIRENATGSILFLGRMVDPRK